MFTMKLSRPKVRAHMHQVRTMKSFSVRSVQLQRIVGQYVPIRRSRRSIVTLLAIILCCLWIYSLWSKEKQVTSAIECKNDIARVSFILWSAESRRALRYQLTNILMLTPCGRLLYFQSLQNMRQNI